MSVVILSYNRPEYTRATLEAVTEASRGTPHEIIAVDNGSGPESVALLADWHARGGIHKLVLLPENRGTSAGFNAGFRAAHPASRFLTKLDNDMRILTPDWLGKIVRFFEDVADAGIVSTDSVNHWKLPSLPVVELPGGERVKLWDEWVSGGGGMTFRREVYEHVGGFCEDFPPELRLMPDDFEYYHRLRSRLGLRSYYLCSARSEMLDHLDATSYRSYGQWKGGQYDLLESTYFPAVTRGGYASRPRPEGTAEISRTLRFVFFTESPHGEAILDPAYAERDPLGGSETALLGLAAALRSLGHEVEVAVTPGSLAGRSCDVLVASRSWEVLGHRDCPGRIRYLWCHDDAAQATVSKLEDRLLAARIYDRCDAVVTASHYQTRRWQERLHLPIDKVFLSPNGVRPEALAFRSAPGDLRPRAHRVYYASVPGRGLAVLGEVWPWIREVVPDAELLVFSSMRLHRRADSEDDRSAIEAIRALPGVSYRGVVGQAELRQAAETCRALAYPCTCPETSGLVALDAMAAGCAVVTTDMGALPETAWQNPVVPSTRGWWETWADEVERVLLDDDHYLDLARRNLAAARLCGWSAVAERWCRRIRQDLTLKLTPPALRAW